MTYHWGRLLTVVVPQFYSLAPPAVNSEFPAPPAASSTSGSAATAEVMPSSWATSSFLRRVSLSSKRTKWAPLSPAHVGEVAGAQLMGERTPRGAAAPASPPAPAGSGAPRSCGGGQKKVLRHPLHRQGHRSRPKRSAASSRRRDSEPPDRADGIITRARGELCP